MAAKMKYRKRRRQAGPAGLVLCLVFVLAAVFLVKSVFVVKRISVSGNEKVGDSQIIGLTGLMLGSSIFSIDREGIVQAFDREGGLALVKMDVVWPNEVRLSVRERVPVAVVDYLGLSLVVDEWGAVIEVLRTLPSGNLPVVTGLSATDYQPGKIIQSSVYGQVDAMVAALGSIKAQSLSTLISELNVSDLDNLYLMSRAGMMVKLGDQQDMDAKLIWMQSAMGELAEEGKTGGTLDVTSGKSAIHRNS